MFPQEPSLQDWQNEFCKQLLKEKCGSLMTLGKGQISLSKGTMLGVAWLLSLLKSLDF